MDRARIAEEWSQWDRPVSWEGIIDFAEHIAAIARNEALEQAAVVVRTELDKKSCPDAYMRIAVETLFALKETK